MEEKEIVQVKINAEFICEFSTFRQWVNHASKYLKHNHRIDQVVCIDNEGRL